MAKKVAKIPSGVVAKLFSTSSSVELEMMISVASIMTGISDTQMDEENLKYSFSKNVCESVLTFWFSCRHVMVTEVQIPRLISTSNH